MTPMVKSRRSMHIGSCFATTFKGNRKYILLSEDAPLKKLQQRVKQERWVNNEPICRWVEIENRKVKN